MNLTVYSVRCTLTVYTCGVCQAEAESRARSIGRLQAELSSATQQLSERDHLVATSRAAVQVLERDSAALRGELREARQAVTRGARELQAWQEAVLGAESEVEGLRGALEAAQAAHMEQLHRCGLLVQRGGRGVCGGGGEGGRKAEARPGVDGGAHPVISRV